MSIKILMEVLTVWFSLLFLCGCGAQTVLNGVDPAMTKCGSKVAAILVGDGFLQILCGCGGVGEEPGMVFSLSGSTQLICHLPTSDSSVFFYFQGVLRHQIVPAGDKVFISSPLSDPNSSSVIRSYALSFAISSSVYVFKDPFSGIQGQIIVP